MEPEGSSPHSQKPATCPYPEPDWPSPCLASNLSKIHFNIILPSSGFTFYKRYIRVDWPESHRNNAWYTKCTPRAFGTLWTLKSFATSAARDCRWRELDAWTWNVIAQHYESAVILTRIDAVTHVFTARRLPEYPTVHWQTHWRCSNSHQVVKWSERCRGIASSYRGHK
jgi:hypothetical protein